MGRGPPGPAESREPGPATVSTGGFRSVCCINACAGRVAWEPRTGRADTAHLLPVKTSLPHISPAILAMGVRHTLAVRPGLLKYHFLYLIKKKLLRDTHMIMANLTKPIVPGTSSVRPHHRLPVILELDFRGHPGSSDLSARVTSLNQTEALPSPGSSRYDRDLLKGQFRGLVRAAVGEGPTP